MCHLWSGASGNPLNAKFLTAGLVRPIQARMLFVIILIIMVEPKPRQDIVKLKGDFDADGFYILKEGGFYDP